MGSHGIMDNLMPDRSQQYMNSVNQFLKDSEASVVGAPVYDQLNAVEIIEATAFNFGTEGMKLLDNLTGNVFKLTWAYVNSFNAVSSTATTVLRAFDNEGLGRSRSEFYSNIGFSDLIIRLLKGHAGGLYSEIQSNDIASTFVHSLNDLVIPSLELGRREIYGEYSANYRQVVVRSIELYKHLAGVKN